MIDRQRISRRAFLRHSAVATGCAAVPLFIPSGVLAAPGPNDRIGIGGIGVGRQGVVVVQQAIDLNAVRIVAMADVNLPRAQQLATAWKAAPYQDYRRLLERKDVDAIITATPEQWRAIVCIHACQAGKDVYAEKPMSLTIHEGRLMV
jgi:predicted dehydrogenase